MSKFQSFWNLASDMTQPSTLNMYVYGAICSSSHWLFGSETDVVTSKFLKDLKRYPDAKRINVYINSPGGDVFAAAAIKNQLQAHPAEVHSYIDGLGASAAVGLAMGADIVHMSRSALIMIHNPSTRVQGEAKDLTKGVEVLQKVKTTIMSIYEDKTGLPEDRLSALMDAETWLTADEALELGFIDKITDDEGLQVENKSDSIVVNGVSFHFGDEAQFESSGYVFCNNISREKLENKLSTITNAQGGTSVMTFEEILNTMTPEQRTAFDNHVQAQINSAVTAKQGEWTTEKGTLENKIQTLEAAAATPPKAEENSDEAFLNSLPEAARQVVVQARAQAAQAEAKLAEAEKAQALANFKTKLAVYDALPLQDTHVAALHKLSTNDAENFKSIEDLLKVANSAMSAGFTPTGSDKGQAPAATALDEINNKIATLRNENPAMDYYTALKQVASADPTLYQRYREETV